MDNSPAYIIAQYLIREGALTDPDDSSGSWKVYVSNLPDGVNVAHDAVGCFNTAGVKDGRLMTGLNIFHHGVQILLRVSNPNVGWAKATDLAKALEEIDDASVTIGSDVYIINNVTQSTDVVALGQEEGTKRREMFSVNFLVTLQEE